MQAHNQGAVPSLGSELSGNGNETVTHPQLLSKGFVWAGVQLDTRSSLWESFSFAPLQSETYKKEMFSEVCSKEAPDGGKTKGTSHYPPWGTCTLKLLFSTLLHSLSTCSPRVHSTSAVYCSLF